MTQALLDRGSLGINVEIRDVGSHLRDAAELEQLGYDALWVAGGQLGRLAVVRDLLRATSGIRVATGIVPLGVHDTAAIADLQRELEAEAPARFVLGLGGPQQPRPMAALAGYLDDLDRRGVGRADRLLAALGPRKTEVARDRAAGAITLLTTPEATGESREILGADPLLVVHQKVVLGSDPRAARDAARVSLGFLSGVAGYRATWARAGFTDDEVDTLSDRLVDALVVHGDEAQVAARVAAHREAGADHVALSVLTTGTGPTAMETARRLVG